jgi:CRISP-associated protein Cas1
MTMSIMTAFSYNHSAINLSAEIEGLRGALTSIDGTVSPESLRGIEGSSASNYFGGFGKMILGGFTFTGRKKHPSTDPVNALLSFGYTLIFNEISSLLDGLGFDPYLGYFHEVEYGRASLACDIQEEFRAAVDKFTLNLINNNMLATADFYRNEKDGSMYLKREAMKKYFGEYEKYIVREFKHPETGENTTLRKCFRIQAEKLAACIKGEVAYLPFKLEI